MDKTVVVNHQNKIFSSYAQNNYGEIFEGIVRENDVQKIVELGVLHGYSTVHFAKGLHDNNVRTGHAGHLYAYDLWDEYPYRHTTMDGTQRIINDNNLSDFVTLNKGDAFKVYEHHSDDSVCLLHVDISNTGETIRRIMDLWHPKIRKNGIIIFEGGSLERDEIEWMKKYKMPSLRRELENNYLIKRFYTVKIYEKFPSVSMLKKNK